MKYGISREEEYKLPSFNSHDEAREYFKELYGESFMLVDSSIIDDEKIYFYDLILDHESYMEKVKLINETGKVPMEEKYWYCDQRIEVCENGNIHILH